MHGALGFDFVKTVYRTLMSTAIAAVIAIPLGIVLGASEKLYRSLEFVIDFFRSTPASAMFPLFLILFGVGDETKISVAALRRHPGDPVQRRLCVMNARKTRLLAAKVMGASRIRVLFDVIALGIAAADIRRPAQRRVAGAGHHRGGRDVHRLEDGSATACSRRSRCSRCRGCTRRSSAAGALGYGLNLLFLLIERRFVHWSGK